MFCENCGKTVENENAKFCTHCGATLNAAPSASCKTCGKELPGPSVRFCPFCGSSTQEEKVVLVCPECSREYEDGFLYCSDCGRRLQPKQLVQPRQQPLPQLPQQFRSLFAPRTGTVETLNALSYYEGEPTFSAKGVLGNLQILSEKLLFKVTFGGLLGGGFLTAGKEIVLETDRIRDVRVGKYSGIFPMLVVEMNDGKVHSFASSLPGSGDSFEKVMAAIREKMLS